MKDNQERISFAGYRLLMGAAALVIVVAGLTAARAILAPFMFALLVAIVGVGPVYWLQEKKVPGPLAAVFVTVVIAGLVFGAGTLLANSISHLIDILPKYQEPFQSLLETVEGYLKRFGFVLPETGTEVNAGMAVELVGNVLKGLMRLFSSSATAIVIAVFLLFEATDYRHKLRSALDASVDVDRLEKVAQDVQRYLLVKSVTSAITGLAVFLMCFAVGVELPMLWGLLAFLLNYIPVVGSIIAAVPALLLALVQLSFVQVGVLAVGYIVINTGVSNFLEPTMMGRQLGLSPLVVFLSLVFWGWVWGPIGMLLSVPITMLIKILLENSDDLRWVAILMDARRNRPGERRTLEAEPAKERTGHQPEGESAESA